MINGGDVDIGDDGDTTVGLFPLRSPTIIMMMMDENRISGHLLFSSQNPPEPT